MTDVGSQLDAAFLLGRAKVQGMVKTLLDIDRAVSALKPGRRNKQRVV